MSVTVVGYSDQNRVPGFFFSVDPSKANTATQVRRALLIGQTTVAAAAGTASIVASASTAAAQVGVNSSLGLMIAHYRAIDPTGEVWMLPIADDSAAQKATATITLSGTSWIAGTLPLVIDGQLVQVAVNATDTLATISARIAATIATSAYATVPVTAAASAAVTTLTAVNAGTVGNDLLLAVLTGRTGYPTGLTATVTAFTGGSGTPLTGLTAALANLGDTTFDYIAHPWHDMTTPVTALLADRWGWDEELFGHAFTAVRGSLGTATAVTTALNDPHLTVMPIADSPHSPACWAAELAAATATSVDINPALPITGIALTVRPPTLPNRFTLSERNTLLYDGASTHTVDDSGTVYIERLTTTYQQNSSGQPDNSYLDVETMSTLVAAIRDMRTFIASRFTRAILVADGSTIPAGSYQTTAQLIGQAVSARYRTQCSNGWAQNPDTFAQNIVAENEGGGVVKLLLPYQIANQLRVVACSVQFTKP